MVHCPNCNALNGDARANCVECGAKLSGAAFVTGKMVNCPVCGASNRASRAKCAQCDARLPSGYIPEDTYIYGEEPISMGEWVVCLILAAIPIVSLIALCVWAFGSTTQESKRNWAKATLLFWLIGIVIAFFRACVMI